MAQAGKISPELSRSAAEGRAVRAGVTAEVMGAIEAAAGNPEAIGVKAMGAKAEQGEAAIESPKALAIAPSPRSAILKRNNALRAQLMGSRSVTSSSAMVGW